MKIFLNLFALMIMVSLSGTALGHGKPAPGLNTVRVPKVPGLVGGSSPIVINQKYARILGKSLFWDTALSSDGSACASCHYHAGADERSVNQFNTGDLDANRIMGLTFQPTKSGGNPKSQINTNYHFWDGRANNIFNGQSPWGDRDPNAGVYIVQSGSLKKVRLGLVNSALASQSVGPPVNSVEMSCAQRQFPDIAQKVLDMPGLSTQDVAPDDSILGPVRNASGQGLSLTYRDLIMKAFSKKYWSSSEKVGVSGKDYAQIEANFPMFFGLAIQLYESTLISDQAPYDTPMTPYTQRYVVGGKVPSGLSPSQKRGLVVFLDNHCQICHAGPTFSSAADPSVFRVSNKDGPVLVDRTAYALTPQSSPIPYAIHDTGFANTGVVPESFDPGQNANDPWGNPLSFTAQYLNALLKGSVELVDPVSVYACDMEYPFLIDWSSDTLQNDPNGYKASKCAGRRAAAMVPKVDALKFQLALPDQGKAFATLNTYKIPSLRNAGLTGPYMHNGSMKSLVEVAQFYNRGGNVDNKDILPQLIFPFGMSDSDIADLVDFLQGGLLDPRVLWEKAPFDHPSLRLPSGFTNEASSINPNFAADQIELIPAVGRDGRSTVQGPLETFEAGLPD